MDIFNPISLLMPFSSSATVIDSIASRLATVAGAQIRADASLAAYAALRDQAEAARIAMGVDQAALAVA